MLEGLLPHRVTHVLRLQTDENAARTLTDRLGELLDPMDTAVAAFEIQDSVWLLEAYFSSEPRKKTVLTILEGVIGEAAEQAVFDTVGAKDWIGASLAGLHTVRVGRILIHGSHDRAERRVNDFGIEIEAALAFGTGHHGTTQGCLRAFVSEVKRRRPRKVLDVGTGTGVLAMAAALHVHGDIVAGDIDPVAVEVAQANARFNGVHQAIHFYVGPGVRHSFVRGKTFDLVFANILAKPLRRLAHSLAGRVSRNGTLILSGLLLRDVPSVLSAYATQGVRLVKRIDLEGWVTLVLKRGGLPARPLIKASGWKPSL